MTESPPPPPRPDDAHFTPAGEGSLHRIFPGVEIRTAAGERLMLSVVTFEPGAEVPDHAHPHEQAGILLSGCLDFTVGEVCRRLGPGDQWRIPGGVRHRCVAVGGPVVALDVFTPVREDYR